MDVVISGDDALCIGAELTRRGHRVHRIPSEQEAAAESSTQRVSRKRLSRRYRRPMPKSRVSQTTVFGAQRPMLRTLHD
jgi:hypothetical protein